MALSNAIQTSKAAGLTDYWYSQLEAHLANSTFAPLEDVRRQALAALEAAGRLPGRKDEHWKYFSLKNLEALQPELNLPTSGDEVPPVPALLDGVDACHLAVRMGSRLQPSAETMDCLPDGLRLLSLPEAWADESLVKDIQALLGAEDLQGPGRVFQAINTAALGTALDNTLILHVAAGVDAGRVHLDWLPSRSAKDDATTWLDNCRLFIVLGNGSRLQLLESFSGHRMEEGNSTSNDPESVMSQVIQAQLAEKAVLDHLRVQQAGSQQHLFQSVQVHQAGSSEYRYTGFELGGGLVRNELLCTLAGEEAQSDLAAAFIGRGESCVDHHVVVDHASPNCSSEQNFRGVLGGRSIGVFNGKAIIREGADGSKVRQSNANLLLSELAEMNTKPELEIYADEVEASHGATVGQLDEQALFYMLSRGIAQPDARRMLTGAFCRAIGARLSDRKLVEQVEVLLDEAMPDVEVADEVTT